MCAEFVGCEEYSVSISMTNFTCEIDYGKLLTGVSIHVHENKASGICDKFEFADYLDEGENMESLNRLNKFVEQKIRRA